MRMLKILSLFILFAMFGCLINENVNSITNTSSNNLIYILSEKEKDLVKTIVELTMAAEDKHTTNIRILGAIREDNLIRVNVEIDGFPQYFYFTEDFNNIEVDNTTINVNDYIAGLEKKLKEKEKEEKKRLSGKSIDYEIDEGITYGNGSIKIIVFGSPRCRFFQAFLANNFEELNKLVENGKISLSIRMFLLYDDNSEKEKALTFLCLANNTLNNAIIYLIENRKEECSDNSSIFFLDKDINDASSYKVIASPTIFIKIPKTFEKEKVDKVFAPFLKTNPNNEYLIEKHYYVLKLVGAYNWDALKHIIEGLYGSP